MPLGREQDAFRQRRRWADRRVQPSRTRGLRVHDLAATVVKRFYGKRLPQLAPVCERPLCPDEPLDASGLVHMRLASFLCWLQRPCCTAQLDRNRDRTVLATVADARPFGHQLAALLAYFWLRVDFTARAKVASLLATSAEPNWGEVHRLLADATRVKLQPSRQSIRRGQGPWTSEQLQGLTTVQSEVASLRAWFGLLCLPATELLGLPVSAPRAVQTGLLAVFLSRLPGVGPYLAVKVLYGLDLMGCLVFDFGIVGPGAVLAAQCLHNRAGGDRFKSGLWPWRCGGEVIRAVVSHVARESNEPWLFVQCALCVWKMEGFPDVVANTPPQVTTVVGNHQPWMRIRGKRPHEQVSWSRELCRRVMRASMWLCSRHASASLTDPRCADFLADASWAATTISKSGHADIESAAHHALRIACQRHCWLAAGVDCQSGPQQPQCPAPVVQSSPAMAAA